MSRGMLDVVHVPLVPIIVARAVPHKTDIHIHIYVYTSTYTYTNSNVRTIDTATSLSTCARPIFFHSTLALAHIILYILSPSSSSSLYLLYTSTHIRRYSICMNSHVYIHVVRTHTWKRPPLWSQQCVFVIALAFIHSRAFIMYPCSHVLSKIARIRFNIIHMWTYIINCAYNITQFAQSTNTYVYISMCMDICI